MTAEQNTSFTGKEQRPSPNHKLSWEFLKRPTLKTPYKFTKLTTSWVWISFLTLKNFYSSTGAPPYKTSKKGRKKKIILTNNPTGPIIVAGKFWGASSALVVMQSMKNEFLCMQYASQYSCSSTQTSRFPVTSLLLVKYQEFATGYVNALAQQAVGYQQLDL